MSVPKVTIKIPRLLYDQIKAVIEYSGYDSVTDFVVYVLRDIMASRSEEENTLSTEEIRRVKKHLRNLGYF